MRYEFSTAMMRSGSFVFLTKVNLVVLANGFCKKSQKTPKKEIEKALKIIREYENEKK